MSSNGNPSIEAIASQLLENITGIWRSWMIETACELNIAEQLSQKPMTAEELGKVTDTHAPSLYRLLRALASIGIFKVDSDGKWNLTPMANLLSHEMKHMTFIWVRDEHKLWQNMLDSIKTGKSVHEKSYGDKIWDFLKKNPVEFNNMKLSLQNYNTIFCKNIPDYYDFKQFKHIIDIGGNNGSFLEYVLKSAPNARGTVFDEKHVIEEAKQYLEKSEVRNRCSIVAGSFLESVPPDGDCYIMKSALVDWNDENAVKIISNVAKQMKPDGKLLIIQSCISDDNEPHIGKLFDILYLICDEGKERTRNEFEDLFRKSGLKLRRVIKTGFPLNDIMEATF